MSKMSFHFAQALNAGRTRRATPLTRESILAGLLQKRAAAARAGLHDLEDQLRSQIRWSLPVHSPPSFPEEGSTADSPSLSFRVTGTAGQDPG
ncbi:MAG: hypothetical protein QOG72_1827 [Sphingomonadales bacterium]|jgi:hypothetical protein|nr:hypothetical protein [Sphingomonadales bacterium]